MHAGDEYRRRARALRWRHRGDAPRMVRALGDLAREVDERRGDGGRAGILQGGNAPRPSATAARVVFAERVAAAIEGGLLRYSRRLDLLADAERMGLARFDACLLIAAVQHRIGGRQKLPDARRGATWAAATLVAAVQALVALGAWWVVR